MKKLWILPMAVFFGIFALYSCGGTTEKAEDSTSATEKEEKATEPGLTLKLDGKAVEFDNVELSYDARFGNQLTISGFWDSETDGILTTSSFSLNIEDISTGPQEHTHISFKDYTVSNAQAEVHKMEIGSGMFGAVIEEIVVDFSATLQDEKPLELTGKYVK